MIAVKSGVGISTFYPEKEIIVSVFEGRVKVDVGMEHYKQLYQFHLENSIKGAVIDVSKLYGSFAKLLGFIEESYADVVASGLTCCAYVISDDLIINNLIGKVLKIEASLQLKTAIFKDRKETEEWVNSNSK